MPTGSSAARDAGLSCLVHNRWIALDFCFPGLLFLRSPGVTLKPSQISSIFAGNPLKLIWQLCEVELIADQIRGADGANGWMGCQGIIQSAGSQWDGTFYLARSEGSESAPANRIPPWSPGRPIRFRRGHQADQSDSAAVTRPTNQILPSLERAVRISPWDEFGRQPSSAAHFLLEHFLWVTNTARHTFLFFSLLLNCFYFIFIFGLILLLLLWVNIWIIIVLLFFFFPFLLGSLFLFPLLFLCSSFSGCKTEA